MRNTTKHAKEVPRNKEELMVEVAKISQSVLTLSSLSMFQENKREKSKFSRTKEFLKLTCGKLLTLNGN